LTDQEGQTLWADGFGGSWEDFPSNIAADANGNVFVAGQFRSLSMQIGSDSLTNLGDADGFLIKYNPDKSVAWAQRIATAYTDKITGLATDSKGRIWVAGQTTNSTISPAQKSVFVMQLDTDGDILWIRVGAPLTGDLQSAALVVDGADNGYFSANIAGTAVFGTSDTVNGCAGFYSGLMVKYSTAGSFMGYLCDSNIYEMKGLDVDVQHIYATGVRIIQGDDGQGGFRSDLKSHVAKYTTSLQPVWGRTASLQSDRKSLETPVAVGVDDLGNVYVNGVFYADTMDFAGTYLINPKYEGWNYPDIFLLKYNNNGDEIRGQSFGGDLMDMAIGLLVWGNNHLMMAGAYQSDSLIFGDQSIVHKAEKRSFTAHGTTLYLRNYYSWLAYAKPVNTTIASEPSFKPFLYPNPTAHTLNLQSEAFTGQSVQVQIFSADGRLVRQQNISGATLTIQLQTGDLPPGMYIATTIVNQQISSARFVKQ
jgi:hypothetical protein